MGQGLRLIAALSVNTSGFNVRGATGDQGRPRGLVAAGVPSLKTKRAGMKGVSPSMITAAVADGVAEGMRRAAQAEKDAELAAKRDAALSRAKSVVPPPKSPREKIGELLAARS